jgi:hypothetical protein
VLEKSRADISSWMHPPQLQTVWQRRESIDLTRQEEQKVIINVIMHYLARHLALYTHSLVESLVVDNTFMIIAAIALEFVIVPFRSRPLAYKSLFDCKSHSTAIIHVSIQRQALGLLVGTESARLRLESLSPLEAADGPGGRATRVDEPCASLVVSYQTPACRVHPTVPHAVSWCNVVIARTCCGGLVELMAAERVRDGDGLA